MKEAKEYNELAEELDALCEACDKLSESTKTQESGESEERIQDAEVNNSDKSRKPDVIGSDDGEVIT